ncbi:MAG: DUF5753 domain-containing protein [Streptosporangiaceae bacterium]
MPGTWFEDWLAAEREALTLRYWQPIIIPGLFQTAEYARALLLAAQTGTSDEAIDALVAARMERRAIFDKPNPPDVMVVLDEAVLHRLIGSPQVMYDQLAQVAEFSARSYISVRRSDQAVVSTCPGSARPGGVPGRSGTMIVDRYRHNMGGSYPR